jgi:hypothetical protein
MDEAGEVRGFAEGEKGDPQKTKNTSKNENTSNKKSDTTEEAQQGGPGDPGDPTKVLVQAHILMARMFFNAPDAVSFAGGVDLGAIVGGAFQKGKIYGLAGSIKGQSTSFVDSGLGLEVGGGASLNISEYYFVNLSGKDYRLTMDDFSGQRLSINASASVVVSLGFGL